MDNPRVPLSDGKGIMPHLIDACTAVVSPLRMIEWYPFIAIKTPSKAKAVVGGDGEEPIITGGHSKQDLRYTPKLHVLLFLLTTFGPVYYGSPS